jgi:phosphatidate cytidylyltransferase
VTDDDPARAALPAKADASPHDDLTLRVISALVLAPIAVGTAYAGGVIFIAFWGLAALGVQWEWRRIVGDEGPIALALGVGAVLFVILDMAAGGGLASSTDLIEVVAAVAALALLAGLAAHNNRLWTAGGVLYASALIFSVGALRGDRDFGFWAILYLFAVVWATDILGYFVGRLVGGPKLSPRLSPKKTWSGALGGALGAVLAGVATSGYAGVSNLPAMIGLGLILSAVSQSGDLFESAVKRRFGTKDAGRVIPGHGGFMDRLDGFLAAALAAAIIGLVRGGFDLPAHGLLVW